MSRTPRNLFDQLPEGLFGPLASPNRRLYWQVLLRLYKTMFDDEVEVLDYGHARSSVIDAIEAVLDERSDLWVDEGGEGAGSEKTDNPRRLRANNTYYALRAAGWLEEERRGYHDYVSMASRVSQCLSLLIEMAEGRPLIVTGKLKGMAAGMRQVYESPREQADTLTELAKDAGRFARHVNSIRGAIKALYDRIRGDLPTREIVATFFDDFLRDLLVRDYAPIKTSENPLRIRDELLRIVTALRYQDEIKAELLEGYKRLYGEVEVGDARVRLDQDLSRLEQVFLNIERQLDAIDAMKVRYERRIDTVIDYATRAPRTLGKDLARLSAALVRHGERHPQAGIALPLMGAELPGEARLAQPKRVREAPAPRAVKKTPLDPKVRARSDRERFAHQAVQVTERALGEFLSQRVGPGGKGELGAFEVRTVRDYFCTLALRRAARCPGSGAQEFPDVLSRYQLTPGEDWVETDYFCMRNVTITRRKEGL
ncbi:Wadjet anti-phage system protein JetA family protein [Thioalkalivibrio thiocyanodenitrificans]|uniref:Wadjet anti-phage system protein JetA family protein n=1 Tax=Thioalkalivibrio thiocyanodenitrificans TaxID=243063 RepID=UPI00036FBB89|nr:Wadjet anti-phage system protein JetA family protein [Thioalkalivibrio thiocyanodenitrificans]